MIKTSELRPAKKFGPGYFIREQMELREWTQEDLSEILGITVKHLNKILQDKQPITLEMAKALGKVFDTSAQYWINIDTGYRLWVENEQADNESEVDIKAAIYERMPISDMLKKGWLKKFKNIDDLQTQVLTFWSWSTLDFKDLDNKYLPCLTRRSEAYNQFNASYAITWYQMARNVASECDKKTYKKSKLEDLYDRMHTYTVMDNGINDFIIDLNKIGVIFFVLPHLQKTYLDGAAFFLSRNPVIVYTARFKRVDNFWFTLAHEIAHVLKHLNEDSLPFVLDNFKTEGKDKIEVEANEMAAGHLRHPEIANFLKPFLGYLTHSKIKECAEALEVHPSIIIGKLTHDESLSYRNLYLYNENVVDRIDKKYRYYM